MTNTQKKHQVSPNEKSPTTSEEQDRPNYFEPNDKEEYYKIEDIDETIFKRATSEKRTIYLMGNDIIGTAETKEERSKIEKTLKNLDTKTLIPIIAAMIKIINKEINQQANN